jgi:RNA polymerase sigma factor (sigma-70 family)
MDLTLWGEMHAVATGHGPADREDLAQDVALAALEAGAPPRRPAAWLQRVARNAAIDRWRVERRRRELAPAIEPPGPTPDPEAALLGRERRRLVRRALAALPRSQRRATLARFAAELPFDEVALRIGTEPVTARTRVHRALAFLRARLAGLRVMLALPGAHAATLGLALLVVEVPARLSPPARQAPASNAETRGPASGSKKAAPPMATPEPAPPASAPAPAPARAARTAREAAAPKPLEPIPPPQTFVFDNDAVEGSTVGPEGEVIVIARPVPQPSLIELRRHFIAEEMKSLEDL